VLLTPSLRRCAEVAGGSGKGVAQWWRGERSFFCPFRHWKLDTFLENDNGRRTVVGGGLLEPNAGH
jgi:hypothetical protein